MQLQNSLDLLAAIKAAIEHTPDKVVCQTGEEAITCQELEEWSERLARHIGAYLLGKGCTDLSATVRIGVNMRRTNLLLPSIYALVKLGCTYVPIDLDVPAERRQMIVDDAGLQLVLTDALVKSYLVSDVSLPPYQHYCQPEAYIIYTSGTTGRPKGISIGYASLCHFIRYIGDSERLDINRDSVILFFTSINFDVSIIEIFGTLYYGATMVVATEEDRSNIQALKALIKSRDVTYASLPTSLLAILDDLEFASLRVLVSIGEPIQQSVAERTRGQQYRYVNGYGPAECTVLATLADITDPEKCNNIGHTLPGVTAYVLDADLHRVKPGEEGELVLGGIQLMPGYVNRPELNAKAIFDNPFAEDCAEAPLLYHTGDIVRLEEDGTFYFIGRRDSQIKLNGHRIELGEVRHHIASCHGVSAAYVRLETLGTARQIVAYLVYDEQVTSLSLIKREVGRMMPYYMIPSFWNRLEAFPLNINGKIDASQLVNKAVQGMIENDEELNSTEEKIMMVVAHVLNLPSVNKDVDLIDELGLTSIQLMRIQFDVRIAGVPLSISDFYKFKTIRQIAENNKQEMHYWFNDDDTTTKPVVVIVSGYADFAHLNHHYAELLANDFSVYVIESYHSILGSREGVTAMEMIEIYREMLSSIIDKHRIVAMMGVCLGGEQALLLAHTLYHDKAEKPAVIVLDGEVGRDYDETKNAQINFPYFSPEVNRRRVHNDNSLMSTTPEFHYEGRVGVFLCSVFLDYWTPYDPEMTERKDYWMKKFFETNPDRWRKYYPEADLTMLPTHHGDFFCTQPSLNMVCDYIKALL